MAQRSFPWTTGAGDGPAGGYSAAQIAEALRGFFGDGILAGLTTTVSGGYNVQIAPGQAMVRGVIYSSDATETLTCTALGSGERRDLVVVEADAAARTCRLRIVTGTPGSGTWPALTQQSTFPSSGIWQVEVARLIVTPGNVTVNAPGALAPVRGASGLNIWGSVRRAYTGVVTVPAAVNQSGPGFADYALPAPSFNYIAIGSWHTLPASFALSPVQAPVVSAFSSNNVRVYNFNSGAGNVAVLILCFD